MPDDGAVWHPARSLICVAVAHALQVRDIFATALESTRENVWGWLEPASEALPHVLLKGRELALGRGSGGGGGHAAGDVVLREGQALSMHKEAEEKGQSLGDLLQPSASVSSRQAAGSGPAFHLSWCGLEATSAGRAHFPACPLVIPIATL